MGWGGGGQIEEKGHVLRGWGMAGRGGGEAGGGGGGGGGSGLALGSCARRVKAVERPAFLRDLALELVGVNTPPLSRAL